MHVFWSCLRKHSLVAPTVKSQPAVPETRFPSLGWKIPLEKETAIHSGRLAGYRPWRSKLVGQDLVTKQQQLSNCSSFFHSVSIIILVVCLIKKAASALKSS